MASFRVSVDDVIELAGLDHGYLASNPVGPVGLYLCKKPRMS